MNRVLFFGECLKELMLMSNYTVKQLSAKTDIPQSRLYDFCNGLHAPSFENALKIVSEFCCSLDYMFGFENAYKKQNYVITDTVSTRVKKAIDDSNISRYRLWKMTNVSEAQLSRWYNGKQIPSLVSLIILADALNCSLDYLAGKGA